MKPCLPLLALILAACAAPPGATPDTPGLVVHSAGVGEAEAHELANELPSARAEVEAFFGAAFLGPTDVSLCPDRAAFDATFPPEWGMGATECWMVAWGVGGRLALLVPGAWAAQACEHDAADAGHVHRILAHELTHVFHGEHNSHPDFSGVEGLDWFCEGLATLASGQLAREHAGVAARAVEAGTAPAQLADGWTGRDRYGVSGSLVAFVDARWGRDTLRRLLSATTCAELLAALGTSETDFLRDWAAWVRAGSPR